MHVAADELDSQGPADVAITLLEDSSDTGFAEVACGIVRREGIAATVSCRFPPGSRFLNGEKVDARGRFERVDFGEDPYLWGDGACGIFKVESFERASAAPILSGLIGIRARAIESIGDEDGSHALMQALVCGYRRPFSSNGPYSDAYAAYQTCGLAHLVAVSGAHLVIVTSLFASVLDALRMPRRLAVPALVAIMCSYLVLSGVSISACRATLMSSIGILSLFGRRRPSSVNALGIGMFAILAVSPSASVSLSLALSALSTIGILLFAPLVQSWFRGTVVELVPAVADGLALTLAASVPSQLYACSVFNVLPTIAPVANIVCAPLFPPCCGFGLAAGIAGAMGVPFAPALLDAASICAAALNAVVGALSHVPYASVPFSIGGIAALAVSAIIAAALWAFWPRAAPVLAIAGLCAAGFTVASLAFGSPDSIIMLDVGQGDACLIRSAGRTLLIDTGNHDSMLTGELARNRIVHLDGVLITHADDDHCGSLDALERSVEVDRVFLASQMMSCEGPSARKLVESSQRTAREVVGLDKGDVLGIGHFRATVIWPASFTEEGGNADSLCLSVDYDGDEDGATDFTALFTGDAEKDELAQMISSGDVGKVDILKVGHHGSRNGMTEEQAKVLHPAVALIGVGERNRYGHPTAEILEMLDGLSCRTYRTDQDGEVRCTLTSQSLVVEQLG